MIARLSNSLLLEPRDVPPSKCGWEVVGVFNPAVAMIGDDLVMLARVAECPIERRSGWVAIPRWSCDGEAEFDWVREHELTSVDARVVAINSNASLRLTSISHFCVLRQSTTGIKDWQIVGSVLPEGPLEEFGIEDARITKIDDTYWITYVAVSQSGVATALMSTTDFVNFKRSGIIFPCENKDVILFPRTIDGDYVALHRPNPRSHFSPPQIWLARSPDLVHWGRHAAIIGGCAAWEGDRVGSGTPPIWLDEGWLTLYHGGATSDVPGKVGCYAAGALLLCSDNPSRVIGRSSEPVMLPTTDYETNGFVPNVVFPTAMLERGDTLQVFYGAADTCVAEAQFSKRSILESLVSQGEQKQ